MQSVAREEDERYEIFDKKRSVTPGVVEKVHSLRIDWKMWVFFFRFRHAVPAAANLSSGFCNWLNLN